MNSKTLTFLKYLLFVILFAAAIYGAFLSVFLIEFNYFTVSAVLGNWSFPVFSTILPIIVFVVPITIKLITKCKFSKLILLAVISVFIYVFLYVGTHCICTGYCKSFTPEKWSMYPEERHYMFDDLTKKHDIIGMSREELTSLLGEPDALSAEVAEKNHAEYMFNSAFLYWEHIVFVFEDGKVSEWYVQDIDF